MDAIWVAIAAFGGAILSALLGFLDSQETFVPRKFLASMLRGVFAAIVFAIGFEYVGSLSVVDILVAIAGGAGIDAIGNRVAGSYAGITGGRE